MLYFTKLTHFNTDAFACLYEQPVKILVPSDLNHSVILCTAILSSAITLYKTSEVLFNFSYFETE